MRRVALLLVGALLISAVVWGCGGSGDDSGGDSNSGSNGGSQASAGGDSAGEESAPGSTEGLGEGANPLEPDGGSESGSADGGEAESGGGEPESGGGGAIVGKGPFDGPAVNGEAATSSEPLTKAQFIKAADDLCRKGGETIRTDIQRNKEAYGMGFGNQPNNKEREEVTLDIIIPVIAIQTEEIAALVPPEGDEASIEAIVAALEKGVRVTEEEPSVVIKGPNPFEEASQLSQEYGFKVCR
jgi:hypothetical protein